MPKPPPLPALLAALALMAGCAPGPQAGTEATPRLLTAGEIDARLASVSASPRPPAAVGDSRAGALRARAGALRAERPGDEDDPLRRRAAALRAAAAE